MLPERVLLALDMAGKDGEWERKECTGQFQL